ncbi:TIGR03943 family putative permease subunit [Modestobacter versicolor]|uniref:TIGR03943 family putative permease subunit n=1 Tax=Modestobacter versicolor TaxID=429133 RepID=UPI0034E05183
MSARPDRTTQHVLLLLLGVVTLVVAGSDRYLDYVRAGFRPFLLVAGAVVLAVAVVGLLGRRPASRSGHEHPGPAVGWLLAAPVAVVLVVAPPALGAYSADRLPATPVTVAGSPPPGIGADDPGTDHRTMTLLAYTIWSAQPDTSALADRRVRLVGFVSPREAGGWYLTRLRVNCCAADATALRVAVPDGSAEFAPDQWVEVVGGFTEPVVDPAVGFAQPAVDALWVRRVEAPAETYE